MDAIAAPKPSDVTWHVLIVGLSQPQSTFTLAPGIRLRPLDKPLSVFDLAAAGSVGFRGWSVLESIASQCNCEIESTYAIDEASGYDALNRAWLASSLLVLRGFTTHLCVACSSYSWNLVAGRQRTLKDVMENKESDYQTPGELPRFMGNLLDFHIKVCVNRDRRTDAVSSEDANWIQEHFDIFNRLAAEHEAFRFALEAANSWRFAKDARIAVAHLWSGIEAMFGISSELVYRISLLSACLLAHRGQARRAKFEQVKKLYGLRSKIVHGEKVSEEKIDVALNDSWALLSQLLMLSINKGHALVQADFDDAVFN
jgi:Apea-like HEPN